LGGALYGSSASVQDLYQDTKFANKKSAQVVKPKVEIQF